MGSKQAKKTSDVCHVHNLIFNFKLAWYAVLIMYNFHHKWNETDHHKQSYRLNPVNINDITVISEGATQQSSHLIILAYKMLCFYKHTLCTLLRTTAKKKKRKMEQGNKNRPFTHCKCQKGLHSWQSRDASRSLEEIASLMNPWLEAA